MAISQIILTQTLNSMYRAGWPSPASYVAELEKLGIESKAEFETRISVSKDGHLAVMTEIVEWGYTNNKMDMLYRLGKLAKEDFTRALYLIGWTEER
jgi:hypothetical protein